MMPPTVLCVFGTRPEAIKMAPVIKALRDLPAYQCKICVTAQHREMLDQVLTLFALEPDYDLNVMRPRQDLYGLTGTLLNELQQVLETEKPDLVLVHGDTSTTMVATLAAYYAGIAVGHVEAGLRTGNKYQPFPEEGNRRITSVLADLHFAPTIQAKNNLVTENIDESSIFVTGNTVVDALFAVHENVRHDESLKQLLYASYPWLKTKQRLVLVTGHRRENFGQGIINICEALLELAKRYPEDVFLYPVHLNPNIKEPVQKILAKEKQSNIHLVAPLEYTSFVWLLDRCYLVLTDSGGIQEEAPSLGKPVIVMREATERPEAVAAGTVRLAGAAKDAICSAVTELMDNEDLYRKMSRAGNPYGDGCAAPRIATEVDVYLKKKYSDECRK